MSSVTLVLSFLCVIHNVTEFIGITGNPGNFGTVMFMNQINGELTVEHDTNKASIFFPFISHVFHIKLRFLPVFYMAQFSVGGQVLYS